MEFVPNEKATPIRYPSIANLMVDSDDRDKNVYPLSNDFQINKKNSLLNGFFTRIGATEVVLEWNTVNVPGGSLSLNYTTNTTFDYIVIPPGFYTVAELINYTIGRLQRLTPDNGITWEVGNGVEPGAVVTVTTGPNTFDLEGNLVELLFGVPNLSRADFSPAVPVEDPASRSTVEAIDLRPARYLDIVCNQLTNNQSVKDSSTAPIVRDVLVRWYFDYDNQSPTDEYGYPILMGYTPFYIRRLYNPPKQIQWQTNVPIGNLSFQLYTNDGALAQIDPATNYLMTLQVSEV